MWRIHVPSPLTGILLIAFAVAVPRFHAEAQLPDDEINSCVLEEGAPPCDTVDGVGDIVADVSARIAPEREHALASRSAAAPSAFVRRLNVRGDGDAPIWSGSDPGALLDRGPVHKPIPTLRC